MWRFENQRKQRNTHRSVQHGGDKVVPNALHLKGRVVVGPLWVNKNRTLRVHTHYLKTAKRQHGSGVCNRWFALIIIVEEHFQTANSTAQLSKTEEEPTGSSSCLDIGAFLLQLSGNSSERPTCSRSSHQHLQFTWEEKNVWTFCLIKKDQLDHEQDHTTTLLLDFIYCRYIFPWFGRIINYSLIQYSLTLEVMTYNSFNNKLYSFEFAF